MSTYQKPTNVTWIGALIHGNLCIEKHTGVRTSRVVFHESLLLTEEHPPRQKTQRNGISETLGNTTTPLVLTSQPWAMNDQAAATASGVLFACVHVVGD